MSGSCWYDCERFPRLLFSEHSDANPMRMPQAQSFASAAAMLRGAIGMIGRVDPRLHDEIFGLWVRIIVASASSEDGQLGFEGVTSFMAWGATFMNGDMHMSERKTAHFLVHEVTHALLFGLSSDDPLVLNSPDGLIPPRCARIRVRWTVSTTRRSCVRVLPLLTETGLTAACWRDVPGKRSSSLPTA